jgi:hypothetical protein
MYIVKSVGVLSLGKIMGAIYGILGVILIPIFLVAGVASSMAGGRGAALGAAGALILAILFPILCGLIGFVAGAGGALLYNQFAKWLGGIELQMQGAPMLQPPA